VKPKDPKYINVPNICFSLTKESDSRDIEFAKQRKKLGFDDSETWSLGDTIALFIIPRLKRYIDIAPNAPVEPFDSDCKEFLTALELFSRDNGARIYTKEEQDLIDVGFSKFGSIIWGLWW
jgi:hypothetical protein